MKSFRLRNSTNISRDSVFPMQQVFSICLFSCLIYQAAAAVEETCLQMRVVWRNPEFSCTKHPHDGTGPPVLTARSSNVFDGLNSMWWMVLFHDREDRVFINVTKGYKDDASRDAYLSLHLMKENDGTETTLIRSQVFPAHDRSVTAETSMTCSEFGSRGPGLAPALPKNMTVTLHLWTEEWNKEKCTACSKTSAEVTRDGSNAELESTSILQKNLEDLLLTGDDHDVVFKVRYREFKAHKSILRARFPVFAEMFRRAGKEWSNGSISIVDCKPETFGDLLRYAYTGKLGDQTPARVMSLYYVADKYEIPSLKRMCVEALKSSLSITIVSDVISFATKHNESGLLQSAETFFSNHMEEIMVTEEWQRFLESYPSQANALCLKTVKTYYKKID